MRRTAGALSGVLLITAATALAACTSAQDVGATKGTAASAHPSGVTGTAPSTSAPDTSAPPNQSLPFPHGAGPPGQGLARFYHQQVDWNSCDVSATCASIWVPLSYDDPDGPA